MISGATATHYGFLKFLPNELGKCLIVKNSTHNLISMGELVSKGCTYYVGSNKEMVIVYRRNSNQTLICKSTLNKFTNTYPIMSNIKNAFTPMSETHKSHCSDQVSNPFCLISQLDKDSKKSKISNAKVKQAHINSGHASFKTLKLGASIGVLEDITTGDIDLYTSIFSKCPHCSLAKIKMINLPQNSSKPATKPGEVLTADLRILKHQSIDGSTHELFIIDEFSCSLHVIGCMAKSNEEVTKAITTFIDIQYKAYNHKVTRWHTDSESIFVSLIAPFAKLNILCTFSAPAMHAARIERYIQTIDRRSCAVLSELPYVLPPNLTLHLHQSVCYCHNLLPTSVTMKHNPPATPFAIRTGDIHAIRNSSASFGGVYSIPMGDGKRANISSTSNIQKQLVAKGEIGVCLGHSNNCLKGYKFLTSNNKIVIRSVFERIINVCPFNWPPNVNDFKTLMDGVDSNPKLEPNVIIENSNKTVNIEDDIFDDLTPISLIQSDSNSSSTNRYKSYGRSSWSDILPIGPKPNDDSIISNEPIVLERRSERLKNHSHNYALITISLSNYEQCKSSLSMSCSTLNETDIDVEMEISNEEPRISISQECIDQITKIKKSFSIKHGMIKDETLCKAAIQKEMNKMNDYGVFELIENHPDPEVNIPKEDDVYIGSMVVMRYKHDATTGETTSMSARLAALGNQQPANTYSDTYAATAPQSMVATARAAFMADAIKNDYVDEVMVSDFDVTGAFLHCNFISKCRIFMKLQNDLNHPWAGKTVILRKSLYGLPESNRLFEKERNIHLALAGFVPSINEPSIFTRYDPIKKRYSLLFIHVDDGQLFSTCLLHWHELIKCLELRFGELTKSDESSQHVGVTFNKLPDGSFTTSQSGYIERMIEEFEVTGSTTNPSKSNLYNDNDTDECSPVDIKWFQRVEGSLIYLLLTRHDVRKEIVFLGSKCSYPCYGDMKKLTLIMQYLNSTLSYGPRYYTEEGATLYGYVDASFNVHPDSRSHTGYFLCIGKDSAPTLSFSSKQKSCISLSSMEAEYVALHEMTKVIVHTRRFLAEIGFPQEGPTIIFEDNESAINLALSPGVGKKSKHIDLRYHYIKDMVKTGEIAIEYIDTTKQRANILTKPLPTSQFVSERNAMMNTL